MSEPETPPWTTLRPLLAIAAGALLGSALFASSRVALPGGVAAGAALVGLLAGLGAKLGRAIGGPAELRVIVFASLFGVVIGDYVAFRAAPRVEVGADLNGWVTTLLADPLDGFFLVLFLFAGIFAGVRLLVGGDALDDVLVHGAGAVPPGAVGTPCPRCGSIQTGHGKREVELECVACGHRFAVEQRGA